jgi:hypothetical protein
MWPGCASGSQPGREADAPTLTSPEQPSTRRTYGRILRWIVTEFGGNIAPDINPDPIRRLVHRAMGPVTRIGAGS